MTLHNCLQRRLPAWIEKRMNPQPQMSKIQVYTTINSITHLRLAVFYEFCNLLQCVLCYLLLL